MQSSLLFGPGLIEVLGIGLRVVGQVVGAGDVDGLLLYQQSRPLRTSLERPTLEFWLYASGGCRRGFVGSIEALVRSAGSRGTVGAGY
jgi:hypothetical protein